MSDLQYILPTGDKRAIACERITQTLRSLAPDEPWRIEIHAYKPARSGDQNRLLWAIYDEILDKGGEAMGGWTKDDLHAFFLITHFGSETKDLFGRKRLVPLKRSSKLSKQDFTDFVESILRFMAERGVVIRNPNEVAA